MPEICWPRARIAIHMSLTGGYWATLGVIIWDHCKYYGKQFSFGLGVLYKTSIGNSYAGKLYHSGHACNACQEYHVFDASHGIHSFQPDNVDHATM